MKMKVFIPLAVVAVLAGVGTFVFLSRDETSTKKTATTNALAAKPACLENNEQLQLGSEQEGIEQAVLGQLTTVPAGTNVDMYFATFSKTTANGSAVYPKKYGSYNFTVKKVTPPKPDQLSWKVVSFVPCVK